MAEEEMIGRKLHLHSEMNEAKDETIPAASSLQQPNTRFQVGDSTSSQKAILELISFFQSCTGCDSESARLHADVLYDCPIPLGHDRLKFLLFQACERGLPISPEKKQNLEVHQYPNWFPSGLTGNWERQLPSSLDYGLEQKHDEFFGKIWVRELLFRKSKQATKDSVKAMAELLEKEGLRKGTYLYRGLSSGELHASLMYFWLSHGYDLCAEFGRGLYLTDSLEYAAIYACAPGSAIAIFDWSKMDNQEVAQKTFSFENDLDLWSKFVKKNVCLKTPKCIKIKVAIPRDTLVIVGPVSENNSNIAKCQTPVPSVDIQQYCLVDQPAFRALAHCFVGFVMLK